VQTYVLKMSPLLKSKVWGGRFLEKLNRTLPDEEPYGESWEVAALPEGASTISNGPLRGKTLQAAVDVWGEELIGSHDRFPLLVKYLDAAQDLSVQVHPGERHLSSLREEFGIEAYSKDEAWLILHAEPGASILWGVNDRLEVSDLEHAIVSGHVVECLRRIEVERGDVFRVSPGTIHAICAGVVLLEIQEPSDTTFRLFDYERPGLDGAPRDLHVAQATHVARLFPEDPTEVRCGDGSPLTRSGGVLLADSPTYRIEQFSVQETPMLLEFGQRGPHVVIVLDGQLDVGEVGLDAFDVGIIPASFESIEVRGTATFVLCAARR